MVVLLVLLTLLLLGGAGLMGFVIKSALVAALLPILAVLAFGYLVAGPLRRT